MTTDRELFFQTVPMFLDYAPRILAIAELGSGSSKLAARLTPDMFSAGENLVIAQGFVLRSIYPLMGQECPELSTEAATLDGITQRHIELTTMVSNLELTDFSGAAERQISHVAGDAQLKQSAADYVQLFGSPNFFFHMSMGYTTLRTNGVDLGKADFDGLHIYECIHTI